MENEGWFEYSILLHHCLFLTSEILKELVNNLNPSATPDLHQYLKAVPAKPAIFFIPTGAVFFFF